MEQISYHIIEISDIPNIDLYMDQVTTFMEDALSSYKRTPDSKILTKTMINNYTKAKIFPPPIKKKYSRMHLMMLIMIFHLKSVLSLKDIGILFTSLLSTSDSEAMAQKTEQVYTAFISLQKSVLHKLYHSDNISSSPLAEIPLYSEESMQPMLQIMLSAIYAAAEKQIAEQTLDRYFA